MSFAHAYFA
jgi:hypothetical protein